MAFFSDFLNWLTGNKEAPEPDATEVFALRIKSMLEATGLPVTYDSEKFVLHVNGVQCGLGNHFDEWMVMEEADREAGIQRFAGLIHGMVTQQPANDPDWSVAQANLRPRIRPRMMLERMVLEHRIDNPDEDGDGPSYQNLPLSDLLCIQIAYDHPNTISSVSDEDLESWGVSEEEALARAVANMEAITPAAAFEQLAPGLWACNLGDCYDSSRMFLTARIQALPLEGRPVVLPASRDALLIAGEHDLGALGHMLQHTVQLMQQPRFDTGVPLLLDGERWTRWTPDEADPHRREWREIIHRFYAGTYGELRELWNRLHEAQDLDVFIANASMLSNGEDSWTYAVWAPVEGLLPEVELVVVFKGDDPTDESFMVRWDDLMELAGHLLTRDDRTFLPYWSHDRGPTGEVLAALEARRYEPPKPPQE